MLKINGLRRGTLTIKENAVRGATGHLADTYIDVRGWGKGLAFINGFNLGWYWPTVGPQGAQYVPGPLLHEGENKIVLLEVESAPSDLSGDCRFLYTSKRLLWGCCGFDHFCHAFTM